jgi:hypothetical protein
MSTSAQHQRVPSADEQLIRELDTLQDLSRAHRDEFLGANWLSDIRDLYNLRPPIVTAPTFRPPISVPQLQMLILMEASDLSDNTPKLYITGPDGKRDRQRETALMAQWRSANVNLNLMYASIWSLLGGTGFLQVGFDPYMRYGKGETFCKWLDPNACFPDPAALGEDDWYYFQLEARLWLDEVRRRFPAAWVKLGRDPIPSGVPPSSSGYGSSPLTMPPGPMSTQGRLPSDRNNGPTDGRYRVRYTFIYDANTREVAKAGAGSSVATDKVLPAKYELMYPHGRYIVDCENIVLYDGDNPHPMSQFPIIRLLGLPALTSFWAPPPPRFTLDLQNLAERMLKQTFENAVRLNNGVWMIDAACGVTSENFGGLPGEIVIYNTQGKPPELKIPGAFPAHFLQYPKLLLDLQKELWGFSQAREGKPGSGNVGTELFDSAVMQSQSITRLRAKLLASSVQRLSQIFFYHMARYQMHAKLPNFNSTESEDGFDMVDWEGVNDHQLKDYEIYMDPASIQPMSASALRKLVPDLRKLKMLDTRSGLEMLNIPGSEEIAKGLETEGALEALSRLKRRQ